MLGVPTVAGDALDALVIAFAAVSMRTATASVSA